jgi:hypothetical protein
MLRSLGLLIMAALLAGLAACFLGTEQGLHRTSEAVRDETAYRETADTMERTSAPTLPEGRTARQETAA